MHVCLLGEHTVQPYPIISFPSPSTWTTLSFRMAAGFYGAAERFAVCYRLPHAELLRICSALSHLLRLPLVSGIAWRVLVEQRAVGRLSAFFAFTRWRLFMRCSRCNGRDFCEHALQTAFWGDHSIPGSSLPSRRAGLPCLYSPAGAFLRSGGAFVGVRPFFVTCWTGGKGGVAGWRMKISSRLR